MITLIIIGASLVYFILGMIFTNWIRTKSDNEIPLWGKLIIAVFFPIIYIIHVSIEFFSRDKQY